MNEGIGEGIPYYKRSAIQKGEYIVSNPVKAGLIRIVQSLIPAILLGLAIMVLSLGFHGAWQWTMHHVSAVAQFVRYGVPSLVAVSMITIGIISHVRHYKDYVKNYNGIKQSILQNNNKTNFKDIQLRLLKNTKVTSMGGLKNYKQQEGVKMIPCRVLYGVNYEGKFDLDPEMRVGHIKNLIAETFGLLDNVELERPAMCLGVIDEKQKFKRFEDENTMVNELYKDELNGEIVLKLKTKGKDIVNT